MLIERKNLPFFIQNRIVTKEQIDQLMFTFKDAINILDTRTKQLAIEQEEFNIELGNLLTLIMNNRIIASTEPPENPVQGQLWLEINKNEEENL